MPTGRASAGVNRVSSNFKAGFVAAVVEACRIGKSVFQVIVRSCEVRGDLRKVPGRPTAWLGLGVESPDWLDSS